MAETDGNIHKRIVTNITGLLKKTDDFKSSEITGTEYFI